MSSRVEHLVVMIPDCGHCPPFEQNEVALEAMVGFVGRVFGGHAQLSDARRVPA